MLRKSMDYFCYKKATSSYEFRNISLQMVELQGRHLAGAAL